MSVRQFSKLTFDLTKHPWAPTQCNWPWGCWHTLNTSYYSFKTPTIDAKMCLTNPNKHRQCMTVNSYRCVLACCELLQYHQLTGNTWNTMNDFATNHSLDLLWFNSDEPSRSFSSDGSIPGAFFKKRKKEESFPWMTLLPLPFLITVIVIGVVRLQRQGDIALIHSFVCLLDICHLHIQRIPNQFVSVIQWRMKTKGKKRIKRQTPREILAFEHASCKLASLSSASKLEVTSSSVLRHPPTFSPPLFFLSSCFFFIHPISNPRSPTPRRSHSTQPAAQHTCFSFRTGCFDDPSLPLRL